MELTNTFEVSLMTTREVAYWFGDDWQGELGEDDQQDIQTVVNQGFTEGELLIWDDDISDYHRGWWTLVEPENEQVDD